VHQPNEDMPGTRGRTILAIWTSIGNSATRSPTGVSRPSFPIIPAAKRPSRARRTLSAGGAETHSNFIRSSIPRDFSCRIGVVMSVRVISGGVLVGREANTDSGYKR
jgi:hypothetical protein